MNTYFDITVNFLNYLADCGFPAQLYQSCDGWQLRFPWVDDADITCNSGTDGKLESYGFPWDDGDVTRDTAEGFRHRLAKLWTEVSY